MGEEVEQASGGKKLASSCWALSCAGFIMLIMAAVATPKLVTSRIHGNEAAASGALRQLYNVQQLHREKGSETYADLAGLRKAELIDSVLASGTKQGYRFECRASTAHPSSAWAATAAPTKPGETGKRYFAIDAKGELMTSTEGPFAIDPETCAVTPTKAGAR